MTEKITPTVERIEYNLEQLLSPEVLPGCERLPGRREWFSRTYGPEGPFEFSAVVSKNNPDVLNLKFFYELTQVSMDPAEFMNHLGALIKDLKAKLESDFLITTIQSAATLDSLAYLGLRVSTRKELRTVPEPETCICGKCKEEFKQKYIKNGLCFSCYLENAECAADDHIEAQEEVDQKYHKHFCVACGQTVVDNPKEVCQDCQEHNPDVVVALRTVPGVADATVQTPDNKQLEPEKSLETAREMIDDYQDSIKHWVKSKRDTDQKRIKEMKRVERLKLENEAIEEARQRANKTAIDLRALLQETNKCLTSANEKVAALEEQVKKLTETCKAHERIHQERGAKAHEIVLHLTRLIAPATHVKHEIKAILKEVEVL